MASKFQNRLVGTVVLVALGVIVLPGLLDGKKKHYEDDFAAIPLVPKPGDTLEAESMPPINQSLPAQPPEGAEAAMQSKNESAEEPGSAQSSARHGASQPPSSHPAATATPAPVVTEPRPPVQQVAPPAMKAQPAKPEAKKPETRPKPETKAAAESKTAESKATESKAVESKPAESKSVDNKPAEKPTDTRVAEAKTENKQPESKPTPQEQAPAGQAFVVQLGALKNADKVNEIVAKLRLSGYRAYTVPSAPVAGQITRIYVGPDASKQKLQSALGELQQLSGLSGQVRSYSAH
ncbi:Cell division protein DedD [Dickeya dianthicola]|uniref:Cell division protein DedD n=2 Tax=Dickeya dianthicola TaxID=204039 RepID=A0AAP2D265_9GAMM|nr:cell division protein DedD [Dickeya dianthicola]AYC19870.1 Cell division protein DedD [Dickeya dianthicola]MBI0436393.1 cell division protein DedD [Dickeya dianthicola]MBI0447423.1 cell division protein DedD [Dickeya dianthicola]MBI0451798.1 cell division protein DedD [Dickeya dianthicola]MBI0456141.1 cell division protein DedD [Dickeya dianthicola]